MKSPGSEIEVLRQSRSALHLFGVYATSSRHASICTFIVLWETPMLLFLYFNWFCITMPASACGSVLLSLFLHVFLYYYHLSVCLWFCSTTAVSACGSVLLPLFACVLLSVSFCVAIYVSACISVLFSLCLPVVQYYYFWTCLWFRNIIPVSPCGSVLLLSMCLPVIL